MSYIEKEYTLTEMFFRRELSVWTEDVNSVIGAELVALPRGLAVERRGDEFCQTVNKILHKSAFNEILLLCVLRPASKFFREPLSDNKRNILKPENDRRQTNQGGETVGDFISQQPSTPTPSVLRRLEIDE